MRIRSVHIDSFGRFRDRSFNDLPEGLTLITGNNESGKTTIMEFMRGTMFPSSKRSLYPIPARTDSGSMELEMESGERMTLIRDQRKVSELSGKKLPAEMLSMDPETYRSVFAMDLNDLADSDAISSENIRNRFLTIPGGEKVPEILKEININKTEIMNDERITERNLIGTIEKQMAALDKEIADLKEKESEYDLYASELHTAEEHLKNMSEAKRKQDAEKEEQKILEAQRNNISAIQSMNNKITNLEYIKDLSDETQSRHSFLEKSLIQMKKEASEINVETIQEEKHHSMNELLTRSTLFLKEHEIMTDRIELLKYETAEDQDAIMSLDLPVKSSPGFPEEIKERSKKKLPFVSIMFFVIGAVFIAAAFFASIYLVAISAALFIIAITLLIKNDSKKEMRKWMASEGYPRSYEDRIPALINDLEKVQEASERIERNNSEIKELTEMISKAENEISALLKKENVPAGTFYENVVSLKELILDHEEKRRMKEHLERIKEQISGLSNEIASIEAVYGDKDGFKKASADKIVLADTETRVKALTESVESATRMPISEAIKRMNETILFDNFSNEISETNVKKGKLMEKMNSMISDDKMNHLLAERNAKKYEFIEKAKEWGMLSIQQTIIDRSCEQLYSRMQPSVIRTANSYLGLMTNGRYSIDPDPRSDDIVIRDEKEKKTSKQWSSGLGDQVYLSIKMAVAKEMGSERLPMILDDVLVRFDLQRRAAAIKAILEFAKDQQVFLFSCDRSITSFFPEDSVYRHIQI